MKGGGGGERREIKEGGRRIGTTRRHRGSWGRRSGDRREERKEGDSKWLIECELLGNQECSLERTVALFGLSAEAESRGGGMQSLDKKRFALLWRSEGLARRYRVRRRPGVGGNDCGRMHAYK